MNFQNTIIKRPKYEPTECKASLFEILKKQIRGNPKTSKSNLKLILTKISA